MSRLFHALVVLGAGVSVSGCGGKAQQGEGSTGAGGSRGGGGGNSGGGGAVLAGGSAGIDLSGDGEPTDGGASAQGNCEIVDGRCEDVSGDGSLMLGWRLTQPCVEDLHPPRTPADCTDGEWFQCQLAVWMGEPLAINCVCVAMTDAGCDDKACPGSVEGASVTCSDHSRLCGCAFSAILVR